MKKIFLSIMMVALAATISVVFTTCSKDEEKPEEINDTIIKGILWYSHIINGGQDSRYGFKFNPDGTYSYDTPSESVTGNYKTFESQKSTGVLKYLWQDNEFEEEWEYTLFKMNVTGSSDFDQLWVYKNSASGGSIIVHFYYNNELVQKPAFGRYMV